MDSSSMSINDTTNGSHNFTVEGYSLAKGMGIGKYLCSDTFRVAGYDWAIYFYPDGKNQDDHSIYVSVFVALASEGTDVRALFELTLLDQSGSGKHKVHSHFDRSLENGPYSLKYQGSMWGYKRFFRRTALETSEFLKDDCLTLHCRVGVVKNCLEGHKQYSISVPPSDMSLGLMKMLESGQGCDIVFQVGDEAFKAHKLVLAARSPVFRAQFFGLFGNSVVEKVVVEDIEPSIFKAMLLFIYSDKLPEEHDISASPSMCTSTNMVQHLLAAADRFNLERLKLLCEVKLCESITADMVTETLALAEQHQCLQLKDVCLKLSVNPTNLGVVMQSEGFGCLVKSYPLLLSEMLGTIVTVNSDLPSSRKRSGSSIFALNLTDGEVAYNLNGRRCRRRS